MTNLENTDKTDETPDFEDELKKLEALVTKMESGELPLEASLKAFETGVTIARRCQQALQQAEQRITQLLTENDASP